MREDSTISSLPQKEYIPFVQKKIIGQKSAISLVDSADRLDMLRMEIIDKDPKVVAQMPYEDSEEDGIILPGKPMTGEELIDWAPGDKDQILYAVRGSENADKDEVGELQGWVQFYHMEQPMVKKLINRKILSPPSDTRQALEENMIHILEKRIQQQEGRAATEDEKNEVRAGNNITTEKIPESRIFEVSYARLPTAEPGQMAAALRSALLMLPQELERRDMRRTASFKQPLEVVAFVDPIKNSDSVRVLESAGFVKKRRMKYEKGDPEKSDVYVLDWDNLHAKLYPAVLKELGKKSS